ncbi:MAG: YggT family protein [Tepidanaerobacteraceae bacterium]
MVIVQAVNFFFQFLYIMVIIRVFLSWVPNAARTPLAGFVYQITDPIVEPFRMLFSRFMSRGPGIYLDFSPLIALFVLNVLRRIIVSILVRILV